MTLQDMREYLSEGERSILLKVKSYYDKVGTISGVAKILDMQPWRVRKYLRKGHRYGLFNFDKFDRRSKIVRKKRSRNFSRVIKIGQNRFTLEELLRLIKEHGSLRKVSSITGIQYVRLYSIVTKRFGKGISQLKKEIKLVKVKDRSFSYSIKKIIRLFKKYGFLPYVSKLTGIPSYHLRKILTKEFGMGLFELRKKLGVRRAYLKRRAIERNVTRYQQVRQVYERTGTLRKAAKELNLSAERVRQILTSGKKLGIFDYETRGEYFKRLKHDLKRDDLIKEIKLLNSKTKLCLRFNINEKELKRLLRHFNIELSEYQQAARMGRYIQAYSKIVDTLGHHPTTTELNSRKEWRTTWIGITRFWGNIGNFRKEFGIEKPKQKVHPNTLLAFQKSKEKRSLLKKERKEKVLNIIRQEGPISATLIRNKLGLKPAMTWNYIKELSEKDLILKIGKGSRVKYAITANKS